jgi:hypothetical protein
MRTTTENGLPSRWMSQINQDMYEEVESKDTGALWFLLFVVFFVVGFFCFRDNMLCLLFFSLL